MKDLGVGGGTFLRQDKPTEIREDTLLSVGDLFLLLSIRRVQEALFADFTNLVGQRKQKEILTVRMFGGPLHGHLLECLPEQKYTLGRQAPATIVVDQERLSRL